MYLYKRSFDQQYLFDLQQLIYLTRYASGMLHKFYWDKWFRFLLSVQS